MNQYEVTVLYYPELETELDKAAARVEKVLTDNGAEITNKDAWGKRKLAYAIKKQEYALYVVYTVQLPGEAVKKVNDTLNITDEVMRFLIVRPDLKAIEKAEQLRAEKAAKNAARGEHADEDDDRDGKEEFEERRERRGQRY